MLLFRKGITQVGDAHMSAYFAHRFFFLGDGILPSGVWFTLSGNRHINPPPATSSFLAYNLSCAQLAETFRQYQRLPQSVVLSYGTYAMATEVHLAEIFHQLDSILLRLYERGIREVIAIPLLRVTNQSTQWTELTQRLRQIYLWKHYLV
ncbi:hypothetical protein U1Q18_048395 [Sarracenia purpurea var. burkii]